MDEPGWSTPDGRGLEPSSPGSGVARRTAVPIGGFAAGLLISPALGVLLVLREAGWVAVGVIIALVTLLGSVALLRTVLEWRRPASTPSIESQDLAGPAERIRAAAVRTSAAAMVLAGLLAAVYISSPSPGPLGLAAFCFELLGIIALGALIPPIFLLQQRWRRPDIRDWERRQLDVAGSPHTTCIRRDRRSALVAWITLLLVGGTAVVFFLATAPDYSDSDSDSELMPESVAPRALPMLHQAHAAGDLGRQEEP